VAGRGAPEVKATVHHFGVRDAAKASDWFKFDGPALRLANPAKYLTPDGELHVAVHVELEAADWTPALQDAPPDPGRRLVLSLGVSHPADPRTGARR
jgi:hypothetical protein